LGGKVKSKEHTRVKGKKGEKLPENLWGHAGTIEAVPRPVSFDERTGYSAGEHRL